jgi:hypothetical protein
MTDFKIVSGHVLRNKTEISTLIGLITAEWSILEMMFEVYMAGGNTRIAAALCKPIRNTETKRQMLGNLIDVIVPDSRQKTAVKELLSQVPKLATTRNGLIHGIIGHDDDQSNIHIAQFTTTDSAYVVHTKSKEQLDTHLAEMTGFIDRLAAALNELVQPPQPAQ